MNRSSDEPPFMDDSTPTASDQDDASDAGSPTIEAEVTRPRRAPGVSERLGSLLPRRYRLPAALVSTAAVVAILAATLPWQPAPSALDGAALSPAPGASAGPYDPVATPVPGATDRPPILAYAKQADLTPGSIEGGVVARDSDFELASTDGTPAADLAARLTVEPSIELAVEPAADGSSVRLRPLAPLDAGVVYRFTLAGSDGRPVDSWAFQAKQAVAIVSTIPRDTETDVPLDTGIEMTFDQDGTVDAASHVTIRPATKGRFEQRGRTLVFIPTRLRPATVYTVTVTRGIAVKGTGEVLATDVRFRFETAARAGTSVATFNFPDQLMEVATAARADLPIWAFRDNGTTPTKTRIEVYRLADIGAAIDAFHKLRGSARWAQWSTDDAVATRGLRRVMAFDARLRRGGESLWLSLPARLAPGWYLVQRPSPSRPTQVVLQVTDVAGYLTVSDSRTLVWANDLANGQALVGATVTLRNDSLGRTDARGLLLTDTPTQLLTDPDPTAVTGTATAEPVVIVTTTDGRSVFLPAADSDRSGEAYGYGYGDGSVDSDQHWLTLHTDRSLYRRTDTVHVWGVVRDRTSGSVPGQVDVELVADAGSSQRPSIASFKARPGPTGAFIGSLALDDLPEGSYEVVLHVGATVVGSTSVQIDRILKPAYRLSVETGRNVYIQGDRIKITTRASFYEGSPVPGVPLRINEEIARGVRTDASGVAIYRTTARIDPDSDYEAFEQQSISVDPARAEEGDIAGSSRAFVVYPSTRTIDATATVRTGRVRVTGKVHLLDRDRIETEIGAGGSVWDIDPRGKPVGGATVSVSFVEYVPERIRTGTQYDWIEKKVIPVYEYRTYTIALRTIKVRTAADGSFSTSIPDSGRKHDYSIQAKVGDRDSHMVGVRAWASGDRAETDLNDYAYLEPTTPRGEASDGYAVGDAIDLTFHETRPVANGPYLFAFAQRGLRDAVVQRSGRLQTAFRSWAVPNIAILGVHFTGTRYVRADEFEARFRSSDRAIDIDLSTDKERYGPGDTVSVAIRTRDRFGKPMAAAVVVQAVDVKMYAIGAAYEAEPLSDLYAVVGNGLRLTSVSHRLQPRLGGEGGDTGGGGDDGGRRDFRDALTFELVQTGADGRARTTFRLSDDLTSWRVSAAAVNADLWAGNTSIDVPVGLPFFADASIAPEYLAGDQPSIQVRAYGSALAAGSDVRIAVESASLGLTKRTFRAKAFGTVTVPLPRLTPGAHTITVTATSGSGATAMTDTLTRTFAVRVSRLERTRTAFVDSAADAPIPGGTGLTTVVVSDASAGRYLPMLLGIAGGDGTRLELSLAAAMASSLLSREYGMTEGVRPAGDFDGSLYQTPDGGIAPVPYASADLRLSALVAIVAPERFHAGFLRDFLDGVLANPKSTRERRVYAIAGLAGLGAPVLPELRAAAADGSLTIREQLITGLGAAAIGDAATARSIAASLWAKYGEETSDTARLRVGADGDDITEATSLMAVLAAATGDVRAPALWAYVETNPSADAPHELYAVAFVERLIDRLPVQPASFAYVIDGNRTVVELETGDSFEINLTTAQRSGFNIEPVGGSIATTSTWREPVGIAAIKRDPDITITRSRTPIAVKTSDLVRVDITVRFGAKAPRVCHEVTELVPSGLIPMGPMTQWYYGDEDGLLSAGIESPVAVVGQRVTFCAEPTKKHPTVRLRYYARVISPGRYVWEPAIVESQTDPARAAMTKRTAIAIR